MNSSPALREEPRRARAGAIPAQTDASILDWLESSGRLRDRDERDFEYNERDEEIADMLVGDESTYEIDDDDDDTSDEP
ncbi:MAG: DUF3134 domain-containing protein [Oscillatoriales cyanobacterium]|nr:MAG: DUF3134 domain-containing protein [Oscillatoriales cyanobacterium]